MVARKFWPERMGQNGVATEKWPEMIDQNGLATYCPNHIDQTDTVGQRNDGQKGFARTNWPEKIGLKSLALANNDWPAMICQKGLARKV